VGARKNVLSNFCRKQKIEPTGAHKARFAASILRTSQLYGKGVCMTSAALRQVVRRHRTHYLVSLVKKKKSAHPVARSVAAKSFESDVVLLLLLFLMFLAQP